MPNLIAIGYEAPENRGHELYVKSVFFSTFFFLPEFLLTSTGHTTGPILTVNGSNDVFPRKVRAFYEFIEKSHLL